MAHLILFDYVIWFFLLLDIIAFVVFNFSIYKYSIQFGIKHDNYTLGCFVFVELALVLSFLFKLYSLLGLLALGYSFTEYAG